MPPPSPARAPTTKRRRRPGRPRRGEEPLDRAAIVGAARRLAQDEGLEGLTTARLAEQLGVTPMAIRHYFRTKKDLHYALVEDVWREVQSTLPSQFDDAEELLIEAAVRLRRIWLDNVELVNLSMAVAPADRSLITAALVESQLLEMAGFPDVGLAAVTLQNFIFGSVATWANRHVANRYFERDADAILEEARAMLSEVDAPPPARAVLESRFDAASEDGFVPGLRAVMAGLRQVEPRPTSEG